jgi:tetratricopeptide (TPR) repeat protein
LKQQAYIYRAYGYVAIEKYEVALSDIKRAKRIAKLDAASVYNKLLGKGILQMDHEDYIMATKYFTKASLKFPTNKDPYCLYIISMVRSYSYSHQGISMDQEEKRTQIYRALAFMDSAIANCNLKVKVPSLYFFRGLLYFQLHLFYEALRDFNVAIDEEEEPTAAYYLARGRTYACLSILAEAMKDLTIALNLDETL